jgi:hypothetical protein
VDVDPIGVRVRASSRRYADAADPHQGQAVPVAIIGQFGVRLPRGQLGGASGQDRVQPDRRAVAGGHQGVGDQAVGSRGGHADAPASRDVLQGAGPQAGRRGGTHGHAHDHAGVSSYGGWLCGLPHPGAQVTARRNVRPPPMRKGIIGGLGVTSGMAIVPRR